MEPETSRQRRQCTLQLALEMTGRIFTDEDPVPMDVEDQQGEEAGAAQNRLTELPFQVQVEFTTRDGSKYLRVKTVVKQSTSEREVAESGTA